MCFGHLLTTGQEGIIKNISKCFVLPIIELTSKSIVPFYIFHLLGFGWENKFSVWIFQHL